MSTRVHEVLGNPFVGAHVLSFLSIKDNHTFKRVNRALFQIFTCSFPRLLQERGRRLLEQAPDETRKAFERHFAAENLSRAQVVHLPEMSGYEAYDFRTYDRISMVEESDHFGIALAFSPTCLCKEELACTKAHLLIGICSYEGDVFVGVLHCKIGLLNYYSLQGLPDDRYLKYMSANLKYSDAQVYPKQINELLRAGNLRREAERLANKRTVERLARRSVCDVVRSFFDALFRRLGF